MPPSILTERCSSPLDHQSISNAHELMSPKRSPSSRRAKGEETMAQLEKLQAAATEYVKGEVQKMASDVIAKHVQKTSVSVWDTEEFKAPDGVTFADQREYRKYMYDNFLSFKHKVGETLLRKSGEIRGNSFDLCDLKDCEIMLLDHTGQVFADDLVNCKVYIGPCGADVFVRNCTNCTFTVACKQLRLRDCSHCKMFLYSATRPALETSHHMDLAPFNGSYGHQTAHFRKANLNPDHNQWDQVHDFSKSSADVPKPHWSKLPESQWKPWVIEVPGVNKKPENPVKQQSDALWFTKTPGGGNAPIMGIKTGTKKGPAKKKSLFARMGPKLK